MADIKGITIEIDGNVGPLSKALSSVNSDLKSVQGTLRAVDKALKLDPSNVELLAKKQKSLQDAVADVREKLDLEKKALEQLKAQDDGSEEMAKRQKELEREITATEASLAGYESELDKTENTLSEVTNASEETEDSQEDLGDAVEEAGDAAQEANGGWSMAKQMLVDFAETAAKAAIQAVKELAGAMKDAVVDSAAYADEMLTLSAQTNLSTDTLQEFQYMSELVDVDLGTITGSLTKLTKSMSSAQGGSGAAADAFKTLGVSVEDSNGNLRSAEDVFYDLIDSLGSIENDTERDALAMQLFGKSAQDLNPLIKAGSDTMQDFADEAHEVGYVLDGDTLDSLSAVDDSFQRMQATLTATRNNIVAQMAPALAEGGGKLLEFAQSVDWTEVGRVIGNVLSTVVENIPVVIDYARDVYNYLSDNVIPIVEKIWETVEPVIADIVAFVSESMPDIQETIGEAMEGIRVVIDAVWPYIRLIIQNTLQTIRNIVNVVTAILRGDWTKAWDNMKKLVTDRINQIRNVISTVFNAVRNIVRTIWNGIKTAIQTPINAARDAVRNAIASIQNIINSIRGSAIINAFNNIRTSVSNTINKVKDTVKNAIDRIKSILSGSISFPHIKIPHFHISGGELPWGIGGKGTPPSISVDWYRKAMNDAILLNGATIFGAMGGSLMGGGEAGKEVILGLDKLKEYAGNRVVNVSMTINAAPGQDEKMIAHEVSRVIQNEIMRKKAVWA